MVLIFHAELHKNNHTGDILQQAKIWFDLNKLFRTKKNRNMLLLSRKKLIPRQFLLYKSHDHCGLNLKQLKIMTFYSLMIFENLMYVRNKLDSIFMLLEINI